MPTALVHGDTTTTTNNNNNDNNNYDNDNDNDVDFFVYRILSAYRVLSKRPGRHPADGPSE